MERVKKRSRLNAVLGKPRGKMIAVNAGARFVHDDRIEPVNVVRPWRARRQNDARDFSEKLVVARDDAPVEQPGDLQRLMISDRIGRQIVVRVFRNGEILEVTVRPVELEQ